MPYKEFIRQYFTIFCLNLVGNHQSQNETTVAVMECSEDFYRENGSSICVPSCYTWTQYSSKLLSNILDVILFTSTFLGFVAGVAVILLSFHQYKRV